MNQKNYKKGLKFVSFFERALKIKDFLIIADLHLSINELLIEKGSFIPRFIEKEILKELKELKNKTHTRVLVINGDIKHDFGKKKEEFYSLDRFLIEIKKMFDKIVIVQGNHDNYIKNIAIKENIKVVKKIKIGEKIIITHGDIYFKEFEEKNKIFIIGNEHPFLKIPQYNLEIPVFLFHPKLIILPAFNRFLKGNNVLNKDFLSPYLKKINEMDIIYVEKDNKLLKLGKLKLN